jgi:hypothetical protein
MMDLIIAIIVVGVALYLINLIPMDAVIKKVVNVLVILIVVVYLLKHFVPANWF